MKIIYNLLIFLAITANLFTAPKIPKIYIAHTCTGGLGQDLFSFSAAYCHSKRLNIPLVLDNDRDNGLLTIFKHKFLSLPRKHFRKFVIAPGIIPQFSNPIYTTPNVLYCSGSSGGYFLYLKWFEEYFEEIKKMITPPKHILDAIYKKNGNYLKSHIKVGIHIRSFLSDSIYHNCKDFNTHVRPTTKYIKTAISYFPQDALFIITADSTEFAEKLFEGIKRNIVFINNDYSNPVKKFTGNTTTLEDFFLLTLCDHLIGSRSSFSWWAGNLIKNPDKIIIVPKNLLSENGATEEEIIPEGWITLPL